MKRLALVLALALAACGDDGPGVVDGIDLPDSAFDEPYLLMAGMINGPDELTSGGYAPSLGPIDVDFKLNGDVLQLEYHHGNGYVSAESLATVAFRSDGLVMDPAVGDEASTFVRDVIAVQPELTFTDPPEVMRVQQQGSVIVIDTLWRGRVPEMDDADPDYEIEFRISLIARSEIPVAIGATPTRADADAARYGVNNAPGASDETRPLQRVPVGPAFASDTLTIHVKGFPAEYVSAAEQSIQAWNEAVGNEFLSMAIADDDIDVLDPRYFVLKWIEPTDDPGFSGLYSSQNDWQTGVALGGATYFHGGVISYRQNENRYTAALAPFFELGDPRIVASIVSDPTVDADTLVFDFMVSVINHEIGHQLGMDHNFEASWTEDDVATSVMDYAARRLRHKRIVPGPYDVATALWTYFESGVDYELPMCRGFEEGLSPTCSHSDESDPVDYVLENLPLSLDLVEQAPVVASAALLSPIKKLARNAKKLLCYKDQILPVNRQDTVAAAADALLSRIGSLSPDPSLNPAEADIVAANILIVQESVAEENFECVPAMKRQRKPARRGCMLPP